MNKRHLFLTAYAAMSALVISFSSCSSDDSEDSSSQKVENGMVINMMKGSYENATKLDGLYINESNNFTFCKGYRYNDAITGEIAIVGKAKGLADVSGYPKTGYSRQVAVLKGYGYVSYNYDEDKYYDNRDILRRLYVEDDITDKAGNILGYRIAYETPFYGRNQEIKLKDEVAFDSYGGLDTLHRLRPRRRNNNIR